MSSRYIVRVKFEDESGDSAEYRFFCNSVTRKQHRLALEEGGQDANGNLDDEEPLLNAAFSQITCDNEKMEDWEEVPMEVMREALNRHPSFRSSG